MWRRPGCQTLSKFLDIWSATAHEATILLKALAIPSETTIRRSAVDREDLKPYSKSEKRPKDFTNHRKKTNRVVVFSSRPFPNILNTGTTDETFLQSGKQFSFRHILKSSSSIYESSSLQFFRTTTGIQSGPDTFDESRFVMTFLTIFRVTEILCSFRLVLEGKTSKEIPEFLEKVFRNDVALSDTEDNTFGPLNRGCI